MVKFAHLADCHLGGWREEKLRELGLDTFREAIEICIKENTAFVLISGDLFNSALPNIELLKDTAEILNKLKENDINVYIVPGSHDFSVSGKTMLDVLEKAGLLENVSKFNEKDGKLLFTIDKTNTKIAGLAGLRGGLDKNYYEILDKKSLEDEKGFKIFLFHHGLNEFKPRELEMVEMQSSKNLPNNFDYYAGGHIHYIFNSEFNKGRLVFPGALFPNNFKELEEFKHGGFYIINKNEKPGIELKRIEINLKDVKSFSFNADDKSPEEVQNLLMEINEDVYDKIVSLRVEGVLRNGKPSDIDFKKIIGILEERGAYIVLRNTNKLESKEFQEMDIKSGSVKEVEEEIIKKYLSGDELFKNEKEEMKIVENLMEALNKSKEEGERNFDFENRIFKDFEEVFKIK